MTISTLNMNQTQLSETIYYPFILLSIKIKEVLQNFRMEGQTISDYFRFLVRYLLFLCPNIISLATFLGSYLRHSTGIGWALVNSFESFILLLLWRKRKSRQCCLKYNGLVIVETLKSDRLSSASHKFQKTEQLKS